MKNFIITLSIVLAAGVTPALAHSTPAEPRNQETFSRKFTGAENVKWTKLEDGYEKVAFTLAGTRAEAYFNAEGELLGTIRNIFYNQLPLVVMQTIGSRFENAVVIEVREITNGDGTSYRVVLEQSERKYNVKLNAIGDVIEQQKEKIRK